MRCRWQQRLYDDDDDDDVDDDAAAGYGWADDGI